MRCVAVNDSTDETSIRLSRRDREILMFLEQQGFATFSQLNDQFFNNVSTCSRRLTKLRKLELISSDTLLNVLFQKNADKAAKTLPFVMEMDISKKSHIYRLGKEFRRKFAFSDGLVKPNMVMHQLYLNDLRKKIEKLIPHKFVLHDPKIKVISRVEGWRHDSIRPDLSFEFNKFKVAVEFERTRKSESRYYEKFLYFQSSIYTHVIYYTLDKRNLDHLISQVRPFSKIAVASFFEPEEVYHNIYGHIDLATFLRK